MVVVIAYRSIGCRLGRATAAVVGRWRDQIEALPRQSNRSESIPEERVVVHPLGTWPILRLRHQHPGDQVLDSRVHAETLEGVLLDINDLVVSQSRVSTSEHLEEDAPQRPNIHAVCVGLPVNHLRSHIAARPDITTIRISKEFWALVNAF